MSRYQKLIICALILLVLAGFGIITQIYYHDTQAQGAARLNAPTTYVSTASQRFEQTHQTPLTLTWNDQKLVITPAEQADWIVPFHRRFTDKTEFRPNPQALETHLDIIAPTVNAPAVNGRFIMRDGTIHESKPSVPGVQLNTGQSIVTVSAALYEGTVVAPLAIDLIEPEINLQKLQDLGITTLLSRGTSNFSGSSSDRVQNIHTGASKFEGIIVGPGEEFSFNDNVGAINGSNGFVAGLVIKGDKLVSEYGGGICQVSSTLFRSAVEAGLTITERQSHSLPVQYYDPQGYDATIYTGVVDLKFVNNTPSYILIQPEIYGSQIAFEIYGRNDGRQVSVTTPVAYAHTGDGGFKTVFTRSVIDANGEAFEDKFYSSYKSPSKFEVLRNPLE